MLGPFPLQLLRSVLFVLFEDLNFCFLQILSEIACQPRSIVDTTGLLMIYPKLFLKIFTSFSFAEKTIWFVFNCNTLGTIISNYALESFHILLMCLKCLSTKPFTRVTSYDSQPQLSHQNLKIIFKISQRTSLQNNAIFNLLQLYNLK